MEKPDDPRPMAKDLPDLREGDHYVVVKFGGPGSALFEYKIADGLRAASLQAMVGFFDELARHQVRMMFAVESEQAQRRDPARRIVRPN